MKRPLAALALVVCVPLAVHADNRYRFKMDHKIGVWKMNPGLRGEQRTTPRAKLRVPLLIRFAAAPSEKVLVELAAEGVRFFPGVGGHRRLHLGVFYPARAGARGLAALAKSAAVRQVDLDAVLDPAVPLDLTSKLIGNREVWPKLLKGVALAGKGMTFGLLDTGIDVGHPDYFRADGGVYAWIDVDKDGIFTPGTDAVDLDADGKATTKELLRSMDAVVWNLYTTKPMLGSSNGSFEPATDWLYADTNGNSKRDHGSAAGFSDATPAFGEPLFLAEDLDGDGKLDPEEKLLRLGSSKIKAALTKAGTSGASDVVRTRGKDLIDTPVETGYSHGNCTSGILVGGQRGHHKWVGMAPEADLLIGMDYKGSAFSKQLTWLVQSKADVVLHEYAPWVGYHLDGSSNHEGLMDAAAKGGVSQVNPAGNLGGSNKHMRAQFTAGSYVSISILVPNSTPTAHYYMHMTFLWRNTKAKLMFTLEDPNGLKTMLPDKPSSNAFVPWGDGKTYFYSKRQDSTRGTAAMNVYVQGGLYPNYKPMASGTWTVWVKVPVVAGNVVLLGYVRDPISRWGKGIQFTKNVSEKGIICWPATADSAITVAAYAGNVGIPYEHTPTGDNTGWLRKYSGRGLRVDGAQIMDVAAPDNPVSPYNERPGYKHGQGAYRVFGGTSGAGPHVAGAALLIKQHAPSLDGLAVRKAIRKGALVDKAVGTVPSPTWGYGKLRVYNSIFGTSPTPNTAPEAKITYTGPVYAGTPVTLTPTVADAEDGKASLHIRWDDTYDGAWDTKFAKAAARAVTFKAPGYAWAKVQVRDTGGLTGAAAVRIKVLPKKTPDAGTSDGGADSGAPDLLPPDLPPPPSDAAGDGTKGDGIKGDANKVDAPKPPDAWPDKMTPDVFDPDLGPKPDYFIPDVALPDVARDSGAPTDWLDWPDTGNTADLGWSGPKKPDEEGCSCGVGGSGDAGIWLLVLLGVMLVRRRYGVNAE